MEHAAVPARAPARLRPMTLARALRPDEWVKNSFVYAAVLFSGHFHASTALRSTGAFAAFCAVASAGYLINDIADADDDRRHPVKRDRAIASGALPIATARVVAVLLYVTGLGAALVVSAGVCG